MQVALVQEGGRTVEQVLCVQQRPQLRTKALLSAYPAEADRNPVPAGLRRVGWQVCGGAAGRIALGLGAGRAIRVAASW